MQAELTNPLPSERIRSFRRGYFAKLGTVALTAIAIVIATHGALLLPAYLYLRDSVSLQEARLAEIAATLAAGGEGEMNARLARLESDATRLVALSSAPQASGIIRAVLAVPRAGITLSGLTFHAPQPDGRLAITGTAATREALRQYALALGKLSFAKSADLPLSAYAKESDIPFTITLTGPLTP